MVKPCNDSSSDGRVIIDEHMAEILKNMNGVSLMIHSRFGSLYFDIPHIKKNCGYLHAISFLTSRLLEDGDICVKPDSD